MKQADLPDQYQYRVVFMTITDGYVLASPKYETFSQAEIAGRREYEDDLAGKDIEDFFIAKEVKA